jgi:hypothetical protein
MEFKDPVVFNDVLVQKLVEYYKLNEECVVRLRKRLADIDCFSKPDLSRHECNSRAPLLDKSPCTFCQNVSGRICVGSCDIQHFCLCVYAWRLGIGGAAFEEALSVNLEKPAKALYEEVGTLLNKGGVDDVVIVREAEEKEAEPLAEVACLKEEVTETMEEDEEEILYPISKAAAISGYSYPHLYSCVKRGELASTLIGGRLRIKKLDLEEFMLRPGSRKHSNSQASIEK